jgi:hypothetical protein
MIVDGMNLKEVRKEILKDIPFLENHSMKIMQKLRKAENKTGLHSYRKLITYRTPFKNLYYLQLDYKNKFLDARTWCMFNYQNQINAASIYEDNRLAFFKGHFLRRYRERFMQKKAEPAEIMQTYLQRNEGGMIVKGSEKPVNGETKMMDIVNDGIALGDMYENVIYWRTFIPTNFLKGKRLEQHKELEDFLTLHQKMISLVGEKATNDYNKLFKTLAKQIHSRNGLVDPFYSVSVNSSGLKKQLRKSA